MMRMTVLASGSKGNSTVVATSRTRILVDAGLSCREILKRMDQVGEDPRLLDAILITHEHQDHVQGVAVLARKLGVPVYFTEMTHRAWVRWMHPRKRMTYADWLRQRQEAAPQAIPRAIEDVAQERDNLLTGAGTAPGMEPASDAAGAAGCRSNRLGSEDLCEDAETPERDPAALPSVAYFEPGKHFTVGDIQVEPFTIPHDAADPVGFVFEGEGVRIGFATDLGYMPANARHALRRCDMLLLESNHDPEMLRDGPYPWSVKQRVMSRVGHLSNEAAAEFLKRNYDGQATYVILAHLSESNNLPALARVSAERALRDRMSLLANKLLLAEQHQPLPAIAL
ncbi:MAG: Metal-dependent hydrolase of the beta-lactamase superfamily [Acidobacteriaceae bacterium]|nr:Metal-dependent hydrolase of the beta-lactamase superfamily [Acidobacteriaceae bacterium]